MKGTINATLPNTAMLLHKDYKEECKHYTIVDLIRNDLNQIADKVRVKKFRYVDGSISGAPKLATVRLIQQAEDTPRGYYTRVFDYFDGHNLDSAVMIRYIEKEANQYYFCSDGGITINPIQ